MANEANVLFKDGTKFYVHPPGSEKQPLSPAQLDAKLKELAKQRGGILDVQIPDFKFSETLANDITIPLPAMPGGIPSIRTMTRSPLQAQSLIGNVTREAGGEAGNIAAGLLASAATKNPAAGHTASILGAGAGRALGGYAQRPIQAALGLPRSPATPGTDMALGAGLEGFGRGITSGLPRLFQSFRLAGTSVAEAAKNSKLLEGLGIEPDLTNVTNSPVLKGLRSWLATNWFSARAVRKHSQKQVGQLVDTLDKSLETIMPSGKAIKPGEPVVAGKILEQAWEDAPYRPNGWRTIADRMYGNARKQLLVPDPKFKPNRLHDELLSLEEDIESVLSTPTLIPQARRQLVSLYQNRIKIPGSNQYFLEDMPIEKMRELRTMIGDAARKLPGSDSVDVARKSQLTRLRDALTENLEQAYRYNGGEDAVTAFRNADRYYAKQLDVEERYLDKIARDSGQGSAAKLYRTMESAIRNNEIDSIAALRSKIGSKDKSWEVISNQYIFDRVLTNSDDVAPIAFMKMYEEMTPQMRRVVLGGEDSVRRGTFDRVHAFFKEYLPDIQSAQKGAVDATPRRFEAEASAIGRLGGLPMLLGATAAGSGAYSATDNPVMGAVAAGAMMTLGPKILFRLITNTKFMNFLLKEQKAPIASIGGHLSRLGFMSSQMDPDDKRAVLEYILAVDQISDVPTPQRPPTAAQANPITMGMGQ